MPWRANTSSTRFGNASIRAIVAAEVDDEGAGLVELEAGSPTVEPEAGDTNQAVLCDCVDLVEAGMPVAKGPVGVGDPVTKSCVAL
jgi:hypothetical protein